MPSLLNIAKSIFISAFSITFLAIITYLINIKSKSPTITKIYFYFRQSSWILSIFAFIFLVLGTWHLLEIKQILLLSLLPILSLFTVSLKPKKINNVQKNGSGTKN